jgi:beta-xylosidase
MKPQTSDEFREPKLSPMWEWNHNPNDSQWSLTERRGYLRLHAMPAADLMQARNTLTESMQDESLEFTAELDIRNLHDGDKAGVSIFDKSLSSIGVRQIGGRRSVVFSSKDVETSGPELRGDKLQLRARVLGQTATYFYSLDEGRTFHPLGTEVGLLFSWWKAARPALFAFHTSGEADQGNKSSPGYVDFAWAHYQSLSGATAGSSK